MGKNNDFYTNNIVTTKTFSELDNVTDQEIKNLIKINKNELDRQHSKLKEELKQLKITNEFTFFENMKNNNKKEREKLQKINTLLSDFMLNNFYSINDNVGNIYYENYYNDENMDLIFTLYGVILSTIRDRIEEEKTNKITIDINAQDWLNIRTEKLKELRNKFNKEYIGNGENRLSLIISCIQEFTLSKDAEKSILNKMEKVSTDRESGENLLSDLKEHQKDLIKFIYSFLDESQIKQQRYVLNNKIASAIDVNGFFNMLKSLNLISVDNNKMSLATLRNLDIQTLKNIFDYIFETFTRTANLYRLQNDAIKMYDDIDFLGTNVSSKIYDEEMEDSEYDYEFESEDDDTENFAKMYSNEIDLGNDTKETIQTLYGYQINSCIDNIIYHCGNNENSNIRIALHYTYLLFKLLSICDTMYITDSIDVALNNTRFLESLAFLSEETIANSKKIDFVKILENRTNLYRLNQTKSNSTTTNYNNNVIKFNYAIEKMFDSSVLDIKDITKLKNKAKLQNTFLTNEFFNFMYTNLCKLEERLFGNTELLNSILDKANVCDTTENFFNTHLLDGIKVYSVISQTLDNGVDDVSPSGNNSTPLQYSIKKYTNLSFNIRIKSLIDIETHRKISNDNNLFDMFGKVDFPNDIINVNVGKNLDKNFLTLFPKKFANIVNAYYGELSKIEQVQKMQEAFKENKQNICEKISTTVNQMLKVSKLETNESETISHKEKRDRDIYNEMIIRIGEQEIEKIIDKLATNNNVIVFLAIKESIELFNILVSDIINVIRTDNYISIGNVNALREKTVQGIEEEQTPLLFTLQFSKEDVLSSEDVGEDVEEDVEVEM